MWKSTPVFADINGDGFPDLIALPRLGRGARIWLGNGKGSWREASQGLRRTFSCGGGLAVGDVNKDGSPDLIVADHCAGVSVYLGDRQNDWKISSQDLNPAAARIKQVAEDQDNNFLGAEDIAVGDINEDGFPDLVVASRMEGGITVYYGDGSGRFWREAASDGLPKTNWANKLLLTDIDGDGHLDVVASYNEGPRVWKGDGKGHFRPYSQGLPSPVTGGLYRQIAVGDVNEDGLPDIVVANIRTGPEIYLQTKSGTWKAEPVPSSSIKGGATSVVLGDLERDGHLDMIVGGSQTISQDYGLFVFHGDGKGNFTELQDTNLPKSGLTFVWGLTLADLNKDGLLDLGVTTGVVPLKRKKDERYPRLQVWINRYNKQASN